MYQIDWLYHAIFIHLIFGNYLPVRLKVVQKVCDNFSLFVGKDDGSESFLLWMYHNMIQILCICKRLRTI